MVATADGKVATDVGGKQTGGDSGHEESEREVTVEWSQDARVKKGQSWGLIHIEWLGGRIVWVNRCSSIAFGVFGDSIRWEFGELQKSRLGFSKDRT
ncbi:hypothetical protein E3N88_33801 [Mikania micrantha]|uniref:Uncharacterized protein n=1 Tax=Mikania micrantha TaxID=192012 RepID=A0A5N6MCK3_9ASTR|nr:hypothetical protein E3N88_33801 [Mikania micrantha]